MIEQAALLDQSHEAIVVRDLDNRIRYWGRGAERLYGWTAEEAVGRSVQELTYRESLSQLVEATGIVMENGAWDGELRQFTKDGREVIVEGHWTLVRDAEGDPKTILAINNDITEKKKLESQFLRAQRLEHRDASQRHRSRSEQHPFADFDGNADAPDEVAGRVESAVARRDAGQRGARRGDDQPGALVRQRHRRRCVTIQSKHLIGEIVRVVEETFPKFFGSRSVCPKAYGR